MNGELTFQDLLSELSEETFVGRVEQVSLFEKSLESARPLFLILSISGQGGVGKTTLLEEFQRIASDRNILTALTNEDSLLITDALEALTKQLNEQGGVFKRFQERYRKYRELKEQLEADPKAPAGLLNFALQSMTRVGFRSLKRIPLAGDVADVLLNDKTEDALVEHTNTLAQYIVQRFTNKDERVLLLDTNAELSRQFVTDLNELALEHRLVLFFDTFERTAAVIEDWLIDLLSGSYGKFSGNVTFILAGRHPLGQKWTRFRKAIKQVELKEFTEAEAREYLSKSGVSDETQINLMLKLSNRLPVLLALLVSSPSSIPTDVSDSAVERFLSGTTAEQHDAALAASVPRFFNQDILAAILEAEKSRLVFDWLSNTPFVGGSQKSV